jgi:hypothetical protein
MAVSVRFVGGEHRLAGDWAALDEANGFLDHLRARAFSPATVGAYAFDVGFPTMWWWGQVCRRPRPRATAQPPPRSSCRSEHA